MSAATIISQAFGEDADLYTTVLGLENDQPSQSQLRKAYYRRALLYHPDKQQGKSEDEVEGAKLKFQAVSLAYTILSDEDKRREYDESGEMDDNDYGDDDFGGKKGGPKSGSDMWKEFFSSTFGKVTTADIDQFTQSYKCSDEEEKDVLKYYTMFKGNLDKMLECVMCSDVIDKERWVQDYIKPAIQDGSVKDFSEQIEKTLASPVGKSALKLKGKKRKRKTNKSISSRKTVSSEEEEDCDDEVDIEVAAEVVGGEEDEEENQCIEDCDDSNDKSLHSSDLSADDNGVATDEERTETEEEKTETEEDSDDGSQQKMQRPPSSSKKRKQRLTSQDLSQNQAHNRSAGGPTLANKKKKRKEDTANASNDLIAAIRGNAVARRGGEESFGNFISSLEERYAPSRAKKKKRKKSASNTAPDIPDDEFTKIQARLLKKKK